MLVLALKPERIVISPGPGTPDEAGISLELIRRSPVPLLGVCLGHQALGQTFGGQVVRAPKIRAMQIIDELEPRARGLYGGALGYIDLRGNLDFCIAIRTLLLKAGKATLQTGAGIVADSDPHSEERETEAKAQALFEALKVAGGLA